MNIFEKLKNDSVIKISDGKKDLYKGSAEILKDSSTLKEIIGTSAWSPNNPRILKLQVSGAETETVDIGFKFLETCGEQLYLNDSRFYARGCIRGIKAHEHDNLLKLNDEAFFTKYIKGAKSLGFNMVRWHSTVPSETFLEISDRLGIFNQIEFAPKYSFVNGKKEFTLDLKLIEETVKKLGWHPSVFAFCLGNEIHNSGELDIVKKAVNIIRTHSFSALVLDSCGWGEADRKTADYLSQHIAYFFPFGKHIDMFNTRDCFDMNGSLKKVPMKGEKKTASATLNFKRNLHPAKPTLAHEAFHYISLPDILMLKSKMNKLGLEHPWWIAEIEKIAREKGFFNDWEKLRKASEHFKKICLKEALERLRMSPWLHGYQMLQLSDCNYYENPNGLLDCFDEVKEVFAPVFRSMNNDFAILADLPKKSFTSGKAFKIDMYSSNYSNDYEYIDIKIKISKASGAVIKHDFDNVYVKKSGVNKILQLELNLKAPKAEAFKMELEGFADGKKTVSNSWDFWVYPEARTEEILKFFKANKSVTDKIDAKVLKGLAEGKKYLFAFNPELALEKVGLPIVKDRFKPVIWDRGHQLGGLVRNNPLTEKFPNSGLIDFQFYNLIEAGAKITLDKIPEITPVIQGLDKATRDRMDSLIFKKGEFYSLYTLRRFGYLFEAKIGKGALLCCTFNFTEENIRSNPEVAYFAEQLMNYFTSAKFKPSTKISMESFIRWQKATKKEVNIEPVMNKYWEEDLYPVETTLWWEKAGVDITKLKE